MDPFLHKTDIATPPITPVHTTYPAQYIPNVCFMFCNKVNTHEYTCTDKESTTHVVRGDTNRSLAFWLPVREGRSSFVTLLSECGVLVVLMKKRPMRVYPNIQLGIHLVCGFWCLPNVSCLRGGGGGGGKESPVGYAQYCGREAHKL